MRATLTSDLAAFASENPITSALINLGVNDSPLPSQATWESDLGVILDGFRAKWPQIRVYVMKPWSSTRPIADYNSMATWIQNVVSARSGWAFEGPDERVWLEGGDNGATMTIDGVHYSAAGNTECAVQWQAVLGY